MSTLSYSRNLSIYVILMKLEKMPPTRVDGFLCPVIYSLPDFPAPARGIFPLLNRLYLPVSGLDFSLFTYTQMSTSVSDEMIFGHDFLLV
jgi:hypothetical protein